MSKKHIRKRTTETLNKAHKVETNTKTHIVETEYVTRKKGRPTHQNPKESTQSRNLKKKKVESRNQKSSTQSRNLNQSTP